MGRLRTAVAECKYKEVDRQLKEQFIHGLNDDEMLVEFIRKLTKCGKEKGANYNENKRNTINVGSEQCYANTGLEKDLDKKDNSADSCTNTGSSLNPNQRLCNASSPMTKDYTVNYLLSGMTNNKPITKGDK